LGCLHLTSFHWGAKRNEKKKEKADLLLPCRDGVAFWDYEEEPVCTMDGEILFALLAFLRVCMYATGILAVNHVAA
jgi:hypothetical protein